ncbi:MAG: hypothetical protein C4542_09475 [Dehalococcoidia bacterium]|nr:MAG: hypothetical protein C4542_09475 [Dehalococcoidia bacterium]
MTRLSELSDTNAIRYLKEHKIRHRAVRAKRHVLDEVLEIAGNGDTLGIESKGSRHRFITPADLIKI